MNHAGGNQAVMSARKWLNAIQSSFSCWSVRKWEMLTICQVLYMYVTETAVWHLSFPPSEWRQRKNMTAMSIQYVRFDNRPGWFLVGSYVLFTFTCTFDTQEHLLPFTNMFLTWYLYFYSRMTFGYLSLHWLQGALKPGVRFSFDLSSN